MTTYSNSGRQRPTPQIATTTIPGDAAHEIARRDVIIDNLQTLLTKRNATIAALEATRAINMGGDGIVRSCGCFRQCACSLNVPDEGRD